MAGDLVVCGTCLRLRGTVEPGCQRCDCESHDDERWQGFDFNTAFELCKCCGAELLRSGSRWSVWFCEPCEERVLAVNRSAGHCVIPIGRHTIMAGIGLAGRDTEDREAVVSFVDLALGFLERVRALDECDRTVVQANFDELGLLGGGDVPLATYLEAVGRLTIDRDLRMQQLLGCIDRR